MKPELITILANGKTEEVVLPCSVADFVSESGGRPHRSW